MAEYPQRKRLRLPEYDYATPGAYFVTICVRDRRPTLKDANVKSIIELCWSEINLHRATVTADLLAVMPDHVHGIVFIEDGSPSGTSTASRAPAGMRRFGPLTRGSLPAIIGGFKSACSRLAGKASLEPLNWQRGYFEHVIRNEDELGKIREYIINNPTALTLKFFERLSESSMNAARNNTPKPPASELL